MAGWDGVIAHGQKQGCLVFSLGSISRQTAPWNGWLCPSRTQTGLQRVSKVMIAESLDTGGDSICGTKIIAHLPSCIGDLSIDFCSHAARGVHSPSTICLAGLIF